MTEETNNNSFDLGDTEEWTAAQFWESDPYNNNGNALARIRLYVDWEKKTAAVETDLNTGSIPGGVFHGLASEFTLPEDTDFTQFPEWYNSEIKPLLLEYVKHFSSEWDGSNFRGYVSEEGKSIRWDIAYKLGGAPKHDLYYSFDVLGAFEGKQHLKEYLAGNGIDILKADLSDKKTLSKIIEAIEGGEVRVLNMDSEDYKKELLWIQEELLED